jgi:ABC-2 type transport system permease protein
MTTTALPLRPGTTGVIASTLIVVRRAVLRYLRTPQLILLATIQMSLFFLIYRYMFGGAIHAGPLPYVDYLVPGFVTTAVLFAGIGVSVATAEDLEQGFIDRLRSLPIPPAPCSRPGRSPTRRS